MDRVVPPDSEQGREAVLVMRSFADCCWLDHVCLAAPSIYGSQLSCLVVPHDVPYLVGEPLPLGIVPTTPLAGCEAFGFALRPTYPRAGGR